MRLIGFPFLVVSSLLWAFSASASTRPHYGGTLHVEMRAAPTSLDPADSNQSNWFGLRNLSSLMFETLVSLDDQGKPEPALAISWQADSGNQRWRFLLRHRVTFQDGTPITSDAVAASLRRTNPTWKVFSEDDTVIIERDSPAPNLPAELTVPRNSLVKRDNGKITGTGPFAVSRWDPGKRLLLAARDDYWDGRVFLDAIEIEMGRGLRDQAISFEMAKAQVTEVAPEQAHRAAESVQSSAPVELIALVFSHDLQPPEDGRQRQALALSIDRRLLNTVVLQGGGEPAGGLLPDWMSGYGFVFPVDADLVRARHLREQVRTVPVWGLGYDANDPLARLLAERVALNARDAGLAVQPTVSATPDVRLVRIPLAGAGGRISLAEVAGVLGLMRPQIGGDSAGELYSVERAMLDTNRIIPLFHLPVAYAAAANLKNWTPRSDGGWNLADAWLASGKP